MLDNVRTKYNSPLVGLLQYTNSLFDDLNAAYRTVRGLPRFINDILELKPDCPDYIYLLKNPDLIKWTPDGSFIIIPNSPRVADNECLINSPSSYKDSKDGLALNAWFVHPEILKKSVFRDKNNRDNIINLNLLSKTFNSSANNYCKKRDPSLPTISEIEKKSSIPYLATIMDLRAQNIVILKNLKETVNEALKDVYGTTEADKVELFFHDFPKKGNTTLHLHIRVNQEIYPREKMKSFSLDELIGALEDGQSVCDILLARQYKYTSVYSGDDNLDIVQKIINENLTAVVENPYTI